MTGGGRRLPEGEEDDQHCGGEQREKKMTGALVESDGGVMKRWRASTKPGEDEVEI